MIYQERMEQISKIQSYYKSCKTSDLQGLREKSQKYSEKGERKFIYNRIRIR